MVLAHLALHWSNFLAFGFRKLVTGPIPLNSSPQPPVYAWSVSQDLADHTFRGDVEGEDNGEDDEDKVDDDEDTRWELRFGVTHLAIAVGVAHFWLRVDDMIGQFFNGPINNVSTKYYDGANKSSDISD